jgi:hypothetical protein
MTERVVRHVVKDCARQAGIEKSAPHDLRCTCAHRCHAAGGELEQIQFLLGHVSVQTTEKYLGCTQRIRGAVNDRIGIEPPNERRGLGGWSTWPYHARCSPVTMARRRPFSFRGLAILRSCGLLPDCQPFAQNRRGGTSKDKGVMRPGGLFPSCAIRHKPRSLQRCSASWPNTQHQRRRAAPCAACCC